MTAERPLSAASPEIRSGDFVAGFRYALRGVALLAAPGIRRYVVLPLLLNIVVLALALAGLVFALDAGLDWLLPGWLDWLRWLLWPLLALLTLSIVFVSSSLVANLLAIPFTGPLALAVERRLGGTGPAAAEASPGGSAAGRLALETGRALGGEFRKLRYYALRAVPCLILFLIPGINAIALVPWLLLSAWMLALEYVDCPLGNHGRFFPAALELLRRQRLLGLGFGTGMLVLTLVPVLNFVAMPAGVAGASALMVERIGGVKPTATRS